MNNRSSFTGEQKNISRDPHAPREDQKQDDEKIDSRVTALDDMDDAQREQM